MAFILPPGPSPTKAADRGGEVRDEVERDDEPSREAYFEALNDGCGCAEIWEYLSDRRRRE